MFASEPLESRRLLSIAGDLDPAFGSGGTARIDFNWANGYNLVNQRMPDGKLLIGGNVGGLPSSPAGGTVVLARLNIDGSLDTTFGDAGRLDSGVPANAYDVQVHPVTGRIAIAAGGEAADEINVAVLSADGVPDAAFDGDGRRVMTFPGDDRWTGMHVAWQGDKLIIATADALESGDAGDRQLVVARLNADGSTDTGFGDGGQHVIASGVVAGDDKAQGRSLHELNVLPDGRIVITSELNDRKTEFTSATAFRLTADGEADATYGQAGGAATIYNVSDGPDNDEGGYLIDTHVGPDGTVYGLWSRYSLADWVSNVTRLDAGGTALPGGAMQLGLPVSDGPTDVGFDDAGRIYVAGLTEDFYGDSRLDWFATRFNVTSEFAGDIIGTRLIGVRDTTYGADGFARGDAETPHSFAARYDADGALTLGIVTGSIGAGGDPKGLQAVRVLGTAPDVVLNKRGSLILHTDDTADTPDEVSLYIRRKDGRLIVRVGDFAKSFAPSRVKRIALFTYGGEDVVTIHPGIKGAYVDAGEGNDTINGGAGDDALLGGGGKDRIYGFDGNDTLLGGASNDYLLGGAGKDDLFGQGGIDTLSGAGGNDRLFGGSAADICNGGNGSDAAAQSEEDTYDSVETMLTLT